MVEGLGGCRAWALLTDKGGVVKAGSWSGAQCWAWEVGKEPGPDAFPGRFVKVLRKTDTTPRKF